MSGTTGDPVVDKQIAEQAERYITTEERIKELETKMKDVWILLASIQNDLTKYKK